MPVTLLLAVCGSIVVLALTHQLQLYIHPRYTAFAATMAAVGFGAALLAVCLRWGLSRGLNRGFSRGRKPGAGDGAHHNHAHEAVEVTTGARLVSRLTTAAGGLICAAVVAGMLVVPPSTLSTRTAVNGLGGGGGVASTSANAREGGNLAELNTHQLGLLLRQATDARALIGEPVTVTGFVTGDADDDDLLHVTRFVISCCAVDAQPIGVPVRAPGWRVGAQWEALGEGDWITVSGTLAGNPGGSSLATLVVSPIEIIHIEEPKEPYEYE